MKAKPIIFSGPMVRAILDGRKTMTRRVVAGKMELLGASGYSWSHGKKFITSSLLAINSPKIGLIRVSPRQPGDILYVRETHYAYGFWIKDGESDLGKQKYRFSDCTVDGYQYEDSPPEVVLKGISEKLGWYRRPSIFMPREAARIFLEVTDVRVERLQDISEEDAIAEGVKPDCPIGNIAIHQRAPHRYCFSHLWESIHGYDSWEANPFVWVISFKRIEKPVLP